MLSFFIIQYKLIMIIPHLIERSLGYENEKTQKIYWNPGNLKFHHHPPFIMTVKQNDEIVFICPYESIKLFWTYNQTIFDLCAPPSFKSAHLLFDCNLAKCQTNENHNPCNSPVSHKFHLIAEDTPLLEGIPVFRKDVPVFFMSDTRFCLKHNMKLAVVVGQFQWKSTLNKNYQRNPNSKSVSAIINSKLKLFVQLLSCFTMLHYRF